MIHFSTNTVLYFTTPVERVASFVSKWSLSCFLLFCSQVKVRAAYSPTLFISVRVIEHTGIGAPSHSCIAHSKPILNATTSIEHFLFFFFLFSFLASAEHDGFSRIQLSDGSTSFAGPACGDGTCRLDVARLLASGLLTAEEQSHFSASSPLLDATRATATEQHSRGIISQFS